MPLISIQTHISPERRQAVYREIVDLSTPRPSYYARVAIATIIASYGLLQNSTAVIIGAMLIAPLMGPIFGIALSLCVGDRRLLRAALASETLGVVIAVAIAVLVGLVPFRLGFGSEILARTEPTLYDLIVAVASALAGAYALIDERIGAALPGVAIATALVPPLATCGLALAAREIGWALGALLLFLANFFAIEVAAAIVFIAFGMQRVGGPDPLMSMRFVRRFALSAAVFAVIAAFLTHTLVSLVRQRRFAEELERIVTAEARSLMGASVSRIQREHRDGRLTVVAEILTPQEFTPPDVARIQELLRRRLDPGMHLVVRSLITKDFDSRGPVFVPRRDAREPVETADRETRFLAQVGATLTTALEEARGARLVDVRRDQDGGPTVITAVVRTPVALAPEQVRGMEDALRRITESPVRLIVRSVLVEETDRLHDVHRPLVVFPAGSSAIPRRTRRALDETARALKQDGTVTVVLEGYTDDRGDAHANDRLAQLRADAVRDYLVAAGVDPARVSAAGHGASAPVATNETAEGRARNRRVELRVLPAPP